MRLGKALFIGAILAAVCLPRVGPAEPFDLSVLYVGHAGSSREKDFVKFLEQHFRVVETAQLGRFREGDFPECDVVILDYDGDGFKAPTQRLSAEHSRPTVTVGVMGARLARGLGLKLGYL